MSWSQTALDNTRRTLRATPLLHPLRALKRLMPRRLFSRSLMIIVIPMILLGTLAAIPPRRNTDRRRVRRRRRAAVWMECCIRGCSLRDDAPAW